MTNTKTPYKEKLVKTIQIQKKLVVESKFLDDKSKEAFLNLGEYWMDKIGKESFTIKQLKSITSEILTYWKESIGIDTELFWVEMQKNNIDFVRKDELNFALVKGKFRRVDIGIGARKHWSIIREFDSVKNRFSSEEVEKLDLIISRDERSRYDILQKCLRQKKIPQTQYLKFGECMAYMDNCGLWDKYFSRGEVEELYHIWTNFGTK